ncbi:MAG: universal stress protein [Anaerolineae bacterium]
MFDKILVPLDGSPLSERALAPALALAQQPGTKLILARVPAADGAHDTRGHEPPTGRQLEVSRREIQGYFEKLREAHAPNIQISTLIPEGNVASAIVDTATAEHVDLILMSTHGYSGVTRWLLGSVTDKVLRIAPCPVLAVRKPDPIQKIAITLDGSELSEHAIEPGLELARRFNASVTFLRSVPNVKIDRSLDETEHGLSRREQQDLIDEAAAYLATRSGIANQSGLEIKTEVRVGPAADTIYEFVETYNTDLIVMATHGRTGLQRWVYGSVTEKVLHSVNTSLLIFRTVKPKRWSMRSTE